MISIIIPTLNEEKMIALLIRHLLSNVSDKNNIEIIVADGNSSDKTVEIAKQLELKVIVDNNAGRAIQMNSGAAVSKGDILYFLHADSYPPVMFDKFIIGAVNEGYRSGCFRMKWDNQGWFLSIFSWMTRFEFNICRGGDQSLFVRTDRFQIIGGFKEDFRLFEDVEIIPRLKRKGKFIVLPHYLITSARKYHRNGTIRLQLLFGIMHLMYNGGVSQKKILSYYRKNII
jgi:rSAM/selenodomain-associated transferase 2